MRLLISIIIGSLLISCNTSKNDPNKAMDDTARRNLPVHSTDEIRPVKMMNTDLPKELTVHGVVTEFWKFNDRSGENFLVLSNVAPYADKDPKYDEDGKTAELNAYHYAGKAGDYKLIWKINDGEKGCPFDITTEFVKDAVTITDLDKDGIAETTVIYRIACRSDVSPSAMKLLMHEGSSKYSLQGLTWYGMGDTKFEVTSENANLEKLPGYKGEDVDYIKSFGRYQSEKEFAGAPAVFISHAREQWMKFVKENLE